MHPSQSEVDAQTLHVQLSSSGWQELSRLLSIFFASGGAEGDPVRLIRQLIGRGRYVEVLQNGQLVGHRRVLTMLDDRTVLKLQAVGPKSSGEKIVVLNLGLLWNSGCDSRTDP